MLCGSGAKTSINDIGGTCESGRWADNAAPNQTCSGRLEVLVKRVGRRGEGPLFGITDVEGNGVGEIAIPSCWKMNSWGVGAVLEWS